MDIWILAVMIKKNKLGPAINKPQIKGKNLKCS